MFGALLGGTAVVSLVLGALMGASVARSLSLGFYIAGTGLLIGSFVVGSRGPLRPDWGPEGRQSGTFIPRGIRRASDDERTDSRKTSVVLFALGIVLVLIGTAVDPTRRAF
jgi:hypothetical protein